MKNSVQSPTLEMRRRVAAGSRRKTRGRGEDEQGAVRMKVLR